MNVHKFIILPYHPWHPHQHLLRVSLLLIEHVCLMPNHQSKCLHRQHPIHPRGGGNSNSRGSQGCVSKGCVSIGPRRRIVSSNRCCVMGILEGLRGYFERLLSRRFCEGILTGSLIVLPSH